MRSTSIGKDELTEEALEIVTVVVSHVPEDRLKVTRSCRLIDRIDNLFEAIGDHFVDATPFERQIGIAVGVQVIIFAIFLLDEIVHIHQELGCGTRSGEHA